MPEVRVQVRLFESQHERQGRGHHDARRRPALFGVDGLDVRGSRAGGQRRDGRAGLLGQIILPSARESELVLPVR